VVKFRREILGALGLLLLAMLSPRVEASWQFPGLGSWNGLQSSPEWVEEARQLSVATETLGNYGAVVFHDVRLTASDADIDSSHRIFLLQGSGPSAIQVSTPSTATVTPTNTPNGSITPTPTQTVVQMSWPVQIAPFISQSVNQQGETFYTYAVAVQYQTGTILISGSPAPSNLFGVDDGMALTVTHGDGTTSTWSHEFESGCGSLTPIGPTDLTSLFKPGANTVSVSLHDTCGKSEGTSGPIILSQVTPTLTPTATSTPSSSPTPTPVLFDSLQGASLNTSNWQATSVPGTNGSIQPAADGLHMKLSSANNFGTNVTFSEASRLQPTVHGDFDITVDFELVSWPSQSGARIGLVADQIGSVQRTSFGPLEYTHADNYVTDFGSVGQTVSGFLSATNTTGKLRLTRTGNTYAGYFWNASSWTLISSYSGASTGDISNFRLQLWGQGNTWNFKDVEVVFRNFSVNRGTVTFPTTVTPTPADWGKPAVVLVHGISFLSCDLNDPTTGFGSLGSDLKNAGYHVEYAHLRTSCFDTPPVESNVPNLIGAIDLATVSTGRRNVVLVAHSMGGVVSRAYIEGSSYRGDVTALYTFGTPHLGVSIDELTLGIAPRLAGGLPLYEYCKNYQPAACEMDEAGMADFNRRFPNRRAGVAYHAIGGDAPFFNLSAFGVILGASIGKPNDGFVSTQSATGLSGVVDRYQPDSVHAAPILGSPDYFNSPDSLNYRDCLRSSVIGGAGSNCGQVTAQKPQVRSTGTSALTDHSTPISGTLSSGQSETWPLNLEGGPTLIATEWYTGTLAVNLIDPTGTRVDSAYAALHSSSVQYSSDTNSASYYFPQAISGNWQLVIQGSNVSSGGTTYLGFAAYNSPISLSSLSDRSRYVPGASAVITATLSGSALNPSINASITRPDGTTDTVTLTSVGENQYRGIYVVPNVAGHYLVRVTASGQRSDGGPFQRERDFEMSAESSSATVSGSIQVTMLSQTGQSANFDGLVFSVPVTSSFSGTIALNADLVDLSGATVSHAVTTTAVITGSNVIGVSFPGSDIYASGRSGPYKLTNLMIADLRSIPIIASEAQDAFTTSAYTYTQFAHVNEINLQAGWNLISLPLQPIGALTLEGFAATIQQSGIAPVAIVDWSQGGFEVHLAGQQDATANNPVSPGAGYFVRVASGGTATFTGSPFQTSPIITLLPGWNLIAVPYSSLRSLTLDTLSQSIQSQGGPSVIAVVEWSQGGFQVHLAGQQDTTALDPVDLGAGYFVRTAGTGSWKP
jgi:pimeloyl-ACP methyl ester carboxylesterase